MKNGPNKLKICLQDVMYSITRFEYGDVREEGKVGFSHQRSEDCWTRRKMRGWCPMLKFVDLEQRHC
jgi:hypothetical protein